MCGRVMFRNRICLFSLVYLLGVCYYGWSSLRQSSGTRFPVNTTSRCQNLQQPRYVTLCRARLRDNHRTGNHLFLLAGLVYTAQLTGRTVSIPTDGWPLDDVFQMDGIHRYRSEPVCPCHEFIHPPTVSYHGDVNLDSEEGRTTLRQNPSRTLRMCGLYQTYRYADAIAPTLRSLLRFRPEILNTVRKIFDDGRPPAWAPGSYTRVGLHVRRGDFLERHWAEYGLTVVDRRYVNRAVDYFTSKFARIHLVVASDDHGWIGDVLRQKFAPATTRSTSGFIFMNSHSVAVTLSRDQSPGVDLALLVACDAMMVSTTSSFGWWAAWIVNGTTVYCDRWSRVGSRFAQEFDHRRYFPQHWIPLH